MSIQKMYENKKNWIAFWNALLCSGLTATHTPASNFQLAFQSIHSSIHSSIHYWFICCSTKKWNQWHAHTFMTWPSARRWFAPTWLALNVNSMSMKPLHKMRLNIMFGPPTNSLNGSASMQNPYWLSWTRFAVFAKWWFASFRFNVSKSTNTGKVFVMGVKPWSVVRLLRWNLSPLKPWFKWHCASYRTWKMPFHHSFSHSSREFTASFARSSNACCCSNNTPSQTIAKSMMCQIAAAIVHHAAMASATNATKATAAARANATASASA